jgi:hypothetical protein
MINIKKIDLKNVYIHFFVFVMVLIGILFYLINNNCFTFVNAGLIEGMKINKDITPNSGTLRCPNLLIQKNKEIYLYNTKLEEVPGVNPIKFKNLEDYNEFLDWQKSQGIRCPVLYLQKSYNTQGQSVYKIRPSIKEPQGGLEPTILSADGVTVVRSTLGDDKTFAYPYSEDVLNKRVKSFAETDREDENDEKDIALVSSYPMSSNWGGPDYTSKLIDKGFFKENNIFSN